MVNITTKRTKGPVTAVLPVAVESVFVKKPQPQCLRQVQPEHTDRFIFILRSSQLCSYFCHLLVYATQNKLLEILWLSSSMTRVHGKNPHHAHVPFTRTECDADFGELHQMFLGSLRYNTAGVQRTWERLLWGHVPVNKPCQNPPTPPGWVCPMKTLCQALLLQILNLFSVFHSLMTPIPHHPVYTLYTMYTVYSQSIHRNNAPIVAHD